MIQTSDWFKTWMEKQALTILRKFTFDGVHESQRVANFRSVKRSSDKVISSGSSVFLINTDKHWHKFIDDQTNIRKNGTLQVAIGVKNTIARSGIARSAITASKLLTSQNVPRGEEWLDLLTGWGDDPQFRGSSITLYLRDKFFNLFEQILGSRDSPVYYYGSTTPSRSDIARSGATRSNFTGKNFTSYNPADIVWDILTTYADLSNLQSEENPDIDYSSWQQWKSDCQDLHFFFQAKFTGQTVGKALQLIRDLTNSDIFANGQGKIVFYVFSPSSPPESAYSFNANYFREPQLQFDSSSLVNDLTVFYGLDLSYNTWQGFYNKVDSASQDNYGASSSIDQRSIVWHATQLSAQNYADRRIAVFKSPLKILNFDSFFMSYPLEVCDYVRVTDTFFNLDAHWFRVFKISLSLNDGSANLEMADFSDVLEYFWLDHEEYGLLDQDYNPLY